MTNQVTSGINATAGDEWVTDLRISVAAKVGAVVKTYRRGCRSCDSWGWGGWRLPSWAGAGVILAGPCHPGRTPSRCRSRPWRADSDRRPCRYPAADQRPTENLAPASSQGRRFRGTAPRELSLSFRSAPDPFQFYDLCLVLNQRC